MHWQSKNKLESCGILHIYLPNDSLCGEVCNACGVTLLMLCMDWRQALKREDYFGYAIIMRHVTSPTACDMPAKFRPIIGCTGADSNERSGVVKKSDCVR
jgi:hypothetical protein